MVPGDGAVKSQRYWPPAIRSNQPSIPWPRCSLFLVGHESAAWVAPCALGSGTLQVACSHVFANSRSSYRLGMDVRLPGEYRLFPESYAATLRPACRCNVPVQVAHAGWSVSHGHPDFHTAFIPTRPPLLCFSLLSHFVCASISAISFSMLLYFLLRIF
jgi:hypothetical protein